MFLLICLKFAVLHFELISFCYSTTMWLTLELKHTFFFLNFFSCIPLVQ